MLDFKIKLAKVKCLDSSEESSIELKLS